MMKLYSRTLAGTELWYVSKFNQYYFSMLYMFYTIIMILLI